MKYISGGRDQTGLDTRERCGGSSITLPYVETATDSRVFDWIGKSMVVFRAHSTVPSVYILTDVYFRQALRDLNPCPTLNVLDVM